MHETSQKENSKYRGYIYVLSKFTPKCFGRHVFRRIIGLVQRGPILRDSYSGGLYLELCGIYLKISCGLFFATEWKLQLYNEL